MTSTPWKLFAQWVTAAGICALALAALAADERLLGQHQGRLTIGSDNVVESLPLSGATNLLQWLTFASAATNNAYYDAFDGRTATNGSAANSATWTTNAGGALTFDGTNDYLITCLVTNDIHGKGACSWAGWVYVERIGNGDMYSNLVFISRFQNTAAAMWLSITSNKLLAGGRSIQTDGFGQVLTGATTLSNTWNLVGFTVSPASGNITIGVNGSILTNGVATFASNVFWTTGSIATSNNAIGADNFTGARATAMRLGESWFFTNSLGTNAATAQGFTNLYNGTRARYGI